MSVPNLILASQSAARQDMLIRAGVEFETKAAYVDEEAIRAALAQAGQPPRNWADALAEAKALKVSMSRPEALVLGADQILECRAQAFEKAPDLKSLRQHLEALSGHEHRLYSAAVIAQGGQCLWRFIGAAKLKMRTLSSAFLDYYLDAHGENVLSSVGGYHIESSGIQLFEQIEGDYFSILGLPLLPVLKQLRHYGVLRP
ncbi:MAG: Maf family protein [Sphingomonadales bacterium]|jgi:septum formation protein